MDKVQPPVNFVLEQKDALLAAYAAITSLYTTTCGITHSRFIGFLAFEAALAVGLFAISSDSGKYFVCAFGVVLSLFFWVSSWRDLHFVIRRVEFAKQLEEMFPENLKAFTDQAVRLQEDTTGWLFVMDISVPFCMLSFWFISFFLVAFSSSFEK